MQTLAVHKRIYYTLVGLLYQFTFVTSSQRFLGIRLSSLVKFLTVILVIVARIANWGSAPFALAVALMVITLIAYWRAKRSGYFDFVPNMSAIPDLQNNESLPNYQRLDVIATGIFSLQEWETSVLFRPAQYWQVPRGDHALMVAYRDSRYLYQFFNALTVQSLQRGWIIYGLGPKEALAITFVSVWGPEYSEVQISMFGSVKKAPEEKVRTIYLTFNENGTEDLVWGNIVGDMQRKRAEIGAKES